MEQVQSAKYLGITISDDLDWGQHISEISSKATKTLGFLRRNLAFAPRHTKEVAYKTLVRPKLEYAAPIWHPYHEPQIGQVEKVQRTAARWTCRRWRNTSSVGDMLDDLEWPSLETRREQSSLTFFYKIHSGTVDLDKDKYLTPAPNLRRTRASHVKCNMMQLTNKTLNKIQASYTLEGTVLENVDNIKYLGVTITNDLKWNTHISNICTKANRTLGFLRRTPFSCPQNVKEAAYKGMVRPILEYGSSVWDPHPDKLKKELEKVQNRAARFVTRNYDYETGSLTGILGQLKWESLKKMRKDNRLILLYKGLKGKAKIPTDDLIPKTRHGRNQHSLAFQIPSASKDVYMYSFFPQTIRDWNDLPESLISSSELSDDSVSKFTSLVRARD